jgi:hypothetical protein
MTNRHCGRNSSRKKKDEKHGMWVFYLAKGRGGGESFDIICASLLAPHHIETAWAFCSFCLAQASFLSSLILRRDLEKGG